MRAVIGKILDLTANIKSENILALIKAKVNKRGSKAFPLEDFNG